LLGHIGGALLCGGMACLRNRHPIFFHEICALSFVISIRAKSPERLNDSRWFAALVVKRQALTKHIFYENRYLISLRIGTYRFRSEAGAGSFLDQPRF
jgi:hypothetical protein